MPAADPPFDREDASPRPAEPDHPLEVIITAVRLLCSLSSDPSTDGTDEIDQLDELAGQATAARGDVAAALRMARGWGERLPRPGAGETARLWEALATVGAVDLQVARAAEPHLDAVAILAEHHKVDELDGAAPEPGSTWGVYAAEGPGVRVLATRAATRAADGWLLDGVKPWCSLAQQVTHALVTAWVDDTSRGLFAVDLRQPGVRFGSDPWVPHGLPAIRSSSLQLDAVAATPVGGPGWYLERDGFAWGGIGVAAIWYGATVGVARRLARQARERELDQIGQLHLGAVDTALHAARAVLAGAAHAVDAGRARGESGALLALRVRAVVADAAETVLRTADHALGPAPLVRETEYVGRVSDLRLYLRQQHAERDLAAQGRLILSSPAMGSSLW